MEHSTLVYAGRGKRGVIGELLATVDQPLVFDHPVVAKEDLPLEVADRVGRLDVEGKGSLARLHEDLVASIVHSIPFMTGIQSHFGHGCNNIWIHWINRLISTHKKVFLLIARCAPAFKLKSVSSFYYQVAVQ